MTGGRLRVWRRPNKAYNQQMIYATEPFGGSSVMVWGCISYDCKLDLITIPMTLNSQRYQQEVLDAAVIPHFDNHPLATRPIFMDDYVRSHRGRAVIAHLRNNLTRYHGKESWPQPNWASLGLSRSSSPCSGSYSQKASIRTGTPRGMAENPHGAHQTSRKHTYIILTPLNPTFI